MPSVATDIGATVKVASARIRNEVLGIFGIACVSSNGIVKIFLKIMRKKRNKHNEVFLLARSKINSTVNIISIAPKHAEN